MRGSWEHNPIISWERFTAPDAASVGRFQRSGHPSERREGDCEQERGSTSVYSHFTMLFVTVGDASSTGVYNGAD